MTGTIKYNLYTRMDNRIDSVVYHAMSRSLYNDIIVRIFSMSDLISTRNVLRNIRMRIAEIGVLNENLY